jgi:hypothetical protein
MKYSFICIALTIIITILSINLNEENSYLISTLVGFLAFTILILSIIGLIKSFKEVRKIQLIFGFILNLFFLILYSYLITSNS